MMALPTLAADLTFARARHGRVYSTLSDWEEDLDPVVGESVLVADGYRWVSLRGAVEVVSDQARAQADIAAMARRYHADDPAAAEREISRFETQERVTFVLRAARVAADLEE